MALRSKFLWRIEFKIVIYCGIGIIFIGDFPDEGVECDSVEVNAGECEVVESPRPLDEVEQFFKEEEERRRKKEEERRREREEQRKREREEQERREREEQERREKEEERKREREEERRRERGREKRRGGERKNGGKREVCSQNSPPEIVKIVMS